MTHAADQERAEFEAWLAPEYSREKWHTGEYTDDTVFSMFAAWQAARRAPAAPETIDQRAKKLKGLQVLTGATAGVPEAIAVARSRFVEAYGRSPLHDDLAYACLLIDAYGGAPAVPVPQIDPVHGDCLSPIGSRVFIRHGRDDDAHACIVTGYYAWGDLNGSKHLHRVFVHLVYEGTDTKQARMLCDCYATAEEALATAPQPPEAVQSNSAEFDGIKTIAAALPCALPHAHSCWCAACDVAANGRGLMRTRMSVCPDCGDKRCARAERHDNLCNAPYKQST